MRVIALSLSFILALGLASAKPAKADPPVADGSDAQAAPTAAAPTQVDAAPYVVTTPPKPAANAAPNSRPSDVNLAAEPTSFVVLPDPKKIRHPFFVGLTTGVAWANPNLQGLERQSLVGVSVGVQGGYVLSQRFTVGFEFLTIEKTVTRGGPLAAFSPLTAQAGCDSCVPPDPGGWIKKTTLFFGQLAPRFEYTPFGENGLFLGASAGLAVLQLVGPRAGFGGAFRTGYRFRVAKVLDFGVEAGAQGQAYQSGSVFMVSGHGVFRPHI